MCAGDERAQLWARVQESVAAIDAEFVCEVRFAPGIRQHGFSELHAHQTPDATGLRPPQCYVFCECDFRGCM